MGVGRRIPLTVRDCIPGDVIELPSGMGRVVVTGNCIGKKKTHRLVRPADDNNQEAGEAYPIPTSLMVVRMLVLYQGEKREE